MKIKSFCFLFLILLSCKVCCGQLSTLSNNNFEEGSDAQPFGFALDEFKNQFDKLLDYNDGPQAVYDENAWINAGKIEVGNFSIKLLYDKNSQKKVVDYLELYGSLANESVDDTSMGIYCVFYALDWLYDLGIENQDITDLLDILDDGVTENWFGMAVTLNMETEDLFMITVKNNDPDMVKDSSEENPSDSSEPEEDVSYEDSKYQEFRNLIEDLKHDGSIPDTDGEYHSVEDYSDSWAQINWYQWNRFASAQNFVLSTDISWNSASNTPNTFNAGCGLIFRENGTDDYFLSSIRMDGYVYLTGYRNGGYLSYPKLYYGRAEIKATHNYTIVVNEGTVSTYIDGTLIGKSREVAINRSGSMGFAVLSGTNKDYGTRCDFENIYFYSW